MRHQIRLFVTTDGCGHEEAAIELMRAAGIPLDELYEQRRIAGYQLSVIATEDDYEEKDLNRQLIERETQGRLPALYLNVTYRIDREPPDVQAIEPLLSRYGFRHLLTESDAP